MVDAELTCAPYLGNNAAFGKNKCICIWFQFHYAIFVSLI